MITITDNAWRAIELQSKKTQYKNPVLRIGVKGGGCVGFSYHIEFEELKERNNDTHIHGPIRCIIVIDDKSTKYLKNAVLLWEKNGILSESFKIKNDDVITTCGCGSSFLLKKE